MAVGMRIRTTRFRFLRGLAIVIVALVAAVEISARVTRWSHNRGALPLDGNLFVRAAGSGKPVLFLHGFRGSGRYWGNHFDAVRGKRLIYVDLLGFGRSPWPLVGYTTGEHVEAIRRSIRPYTQDQKLTIVGHSLGAILALELARLHPDDVERIIVLGLPVFESETEARQRVHEMSSMAATFSLQPFAARASCDLLCAFRPLLWHAAPCLDRRVPPEVARDAVLHRWESFDRTLRNVVLRSRAAETMRALHGIPVTIIQGRDDHVTDPQRLREIASASGAELLIVPGDHNAFLENPEQITAIVAARLNGTPSVSDADEASLRIADSSSDTRPSILSRPACAPSCDASTNARCFIYSSLLSSGPTGPSIESSTKFRSRAHDEITLGSHRGLGVRQTALRTTRGAVRSRIGNVALEERLAERAAQDLRFVDRFVHLSSPHR
jgi:pimeloyl-ACP methyl ester carboxylesterase